MITPVLYTYYLHKYGGIYLVTNVCTHANTGERMVVYDHVYPFEEASFVRPLDELTADRFTAIPYSEVQELMKGDRLEYQIMVGKARATG
jgi:hypothetical protein